MSLSEPELPIVVEQVTKRYGSRLALDQVSLQVRGGVTGLLGPNGSGKSTLIKALLGLVHLDQGRGTVLGRRWPQECRTLRDSIGYLPEDDCYIAGLQGIECVQLAARLSGIPGSEAKRRAHEVLDYCDIGQERYRLVEGYSTGMRQKLKFAQAIVHDPPLVILDEPTTGLDPSQRQEFLQRITTLAKRHGKTILLSTHILHDVRQVCDEVIILAKGRVRMMETLETLSRPAKPGLRVRVLRHAERFCQSAIRESVNAVMDSNGFIRLPGLTLADSHRVWAWAAEVETAVERLEPERASLEQIFLDVVRETSHAHS